MIKKIKLGYVTRDAGGWVWIPYVNRDNTVSCVPLRLFFKYVMDGDKYIYKYKNMKELRLACQFPDDVLMDEIEHDTTGPVTEFNAGRLYIDQHEKGFYTIIKSPAGYELFPIRSISRHADFIPNYTSGSLKELADTYGNKLIEVKLHD
ncbi:hypothetical protein clP1_014 [Pediococcus phage cIP1]|uniref:Uncharacterized protein n=1 Tax=Pediococcus phage cIP1 TaxID=2681621 RepID=G8FUZ7_9CAUD|nr:hypothetical protein clP1_014 [Pediococcus phage cIP1]AER59773.1 hypothetical protein clP1_014 [Pediococcus phage cIP1]